jgi:hypothetical protein
MKRPSDMFQHTVARDIRCRTTATTATIPEEAPAANHHPATAPMAVCIYAAESVNVVALSAVGGHFPNSRSLQACQPVPAALASEASGETRVREGGHMDMDVTLMPRLPPAERPGDLDDGGVLCKDCNMWLNGPGLYSDHLIGARHLKAASKTRKKNAWAASSIPSPFPT